MARSPVARGIYLPLRESARTVYSLPSTIRRTIQLQIGWRWFARLWRCPPVPSVLYGSPSNDDVALIMCLWNRRSRIDSILKMLDQQVTSRRIRLILWNNSVADRDYYDKKVRGQIFAGAVSSVELVQSPHNIRGIARFIAIKHLVNSGYTGGYLMLDDDQEVSSSFVATLLNDYEPRCIAGCWAWRASAHDYWKREAALPGEPANYVGTGGCVCDSAIVADDTFFTELPMAGLFVEDVWMCRYALDRGWKVRRCNAAISFGHEDDNQYHDLRDHKVVLWKKLHKRANGVDSTSSFPQGREPSSGRKLGCGFRGNDDVT